MSNLDGFRVSITCHVGTDETVVFMDNVDVDTTADLLKQWARPRLLRRGSGLFALNAEGEAVFVRWRDVIDLHAQPQAEAIL